MRPNASAIARLAVPMALVLATALFLHARSRPEVQVARRPVADFPRSLEEWNSKDIGISQDIRDVLGPGDFLSRVYFKPGEPYVDFFLAYFSSQRMDNSIHSPKNCLPGSGWMPTESGFLSVDAPDGRRITVNRYVIANGLDRQLVLYWYQAHSRVVASEYWAKFFLVHDAITMNRSDGSLVRVITPVAPNESMDAAQQRAVGFARLALSRLDNVIPR